MSSKIYPAGRFTLETNVQEFEKGNFRGIVFIREQAGGMMKENIYICEQVRNTAAEAQADADRYAAVRQQEQAPNE
jgi:hypothetical protein